MRHFGRSLVGGMRSGNGSTFYRRLGGTRWNNHWYCSMQGWGGRNVTLKEILPVMAWGIWDLWVGLSVVTHVDNEATVAFLNYVYSKEGHLVRT